ncbi:MAG: hypothetical protein ACE5DK_06130 [Paracoccaceae bacterium]
MKGIAFAAALALAGTQVMAQSVESPRILGGWWNYNQPHDYVGGTTKSTQSQPDPMVIWGVVIVALLVLLANHKSFKF